MQTPQTQAISLCCRLRCLRKLSLACAHRTQCQERSSHLVVPLSWSTRVRNRRLQDKLAHQALVFIACVYIMRLNQHFMKSTADKFKCRLLQESSTNIKVEATLYIIEKRNIGSIPIIFPISRRCFAHHFQSLSPELLKGRESVANLFLSVCTFTEHVDMRASRYAARQVPSSCFPNVFKRWEGSRCRKQTHGLSVMEPAAMTTKEELGSEATAANFHPTLILIVSLRCPPWVTSLRWHAVPLLWDRTLLGTFLKSQGAVSKNRRRAAQT